MTYIPTQAELEEMGFTQNMWGDMQKETKDFNITIDAYGEYFSGLLVFKNHMGHTHKKEHFYPQSRQDIETLVRLFTKP